MLRVWVDSQPVGTVDRMGRRGSTFAYDRGASDHDAVSLTMPPRVQSYDGEHELLPIFDMNLPEGALREHLRLRFSKAVGTFEDLDLLAVTGRSQIGRVRLTPAGETLDEDVPFKSVDEILKARRGGGLYEYLMDTFARHSGLSGVQPKAMIRGEEPDGRRSPSLKGATHIVKFWEASEYPELAANEFFCLSAARALGLSVPGFELSETGESLVVERFDLRDDGSYRGFEDLCVLNGLTSSRKYEGGYETKVFRRIEENLPFDRRLEASRELFRLFVLNCAIRNGDAHLKNFGLVYDTPRQGVRLAPAYDLVTTCAYVPNDSMALRLNGSTDWPNRKRLLQLGQGRARLTPAAVNEVLESVADALTDAATEARAYFGDCPHPEIGNAMLTAWNDGVRTSLGLDDRTSLLMSEGSAFIR